MERRRWEMLDWIVLTTFLVVGLVLSFRPLQDVDLGWHLAGGLWILDNRTVPFADPLSAGARFWLCYSWLPEVFFALIYKAWGFRGLQAAQVLSILSSVIFVYWFVRRMCRPKSSGENGSNFSGRISELLTFSIVLLLVAPVWHLRPQLLSVVLFGVMLVLAQERRFSMLILLPLTIFWANVHVYWIAVPLIAGVYLVFTPIIARRPAEAVRGALVCLVLFFSGVATPYLFRIFPAVVEYMFFHGQANRLIKEFQPVAPRIGLLFWLLAAVTVLLVSTAWTIRRRVPIEAILLAAVFLIMAFLRRKYLPLFGLAATPLLVNGAFPALIEKLFKGKVPVAGVQAAAIPLRHRAAILFLTGVFLLLAITSIKIEAPLTDRYRELFDVAADVSRALPDGESPVVIGNHFDDGGWMELAFYLDRKPGASESRFKPAIDGRTLVMGQGRLKDFGDLYFNPGSEKNCEIIERWNVAAFILPKDDRFTSQFYGGEKLLPCLSDWQFSERGSQWVIGLPISKSGPEIKN